MLRTIDVDDVSVAWLSEALGYPVRSFTSKRVGAGQTGATARLLLDTDEGQKTLILKTAIGALEARKRVAAGYRREYEFYAKLVAKLDVRVPHCWSASISEDFTKYSLLFEDLSPRVAGVQVEGCSLSRVRSAIRNLVGLHAPNWNDTALFEHDFLTRSCRPERAIRVAEMMQPACAAFVERYREELGPEDVQTLLAVADATLAWCYALPEPFAVIHGDYRLDNLMFGADDNDVVVLDWQTTEIGPPTRDLAYFLGTALPVDERRQHERELVREYFEELRSHGVKDYDFDQCFSGYRIGFFLVSLTTILGCIYATGVRSPESDAMFMSMAKRSCAAIRDLDSFELLRSLA